jgi:hypothetical protein
LFLSKEFYTILFSNIKTTETKVKQKWLLMIETSEEILISARPEKCTKLPVLTATLRQKCLSNLTLKDRFIAGIVFLTTGHPEKTDTKILFV